MNRRDFLNLAALPAFSILQRNRPTLPYGVTAGDVSGGRAVIWSRSDRASRMFVEYSTTERFADPRRVRGPAAIESSDFTSRVVLTDLPEGQRIFYRVQYEDLSELGNLSEPVTGSFSTASRGRDVRIAWSADTAGQGWGINPDFGGYKLYETMRREQPDVFINVGDTIYADGPIQREVKLDDGTIWKNLVTEAKSKVAQSLDDYRGCYQYNLMDDHMRRFVSEVPQIVMWDDHEVRDNWYWERRNDSDNRYTEKSVAVLAARARQAFFEYNPLPQLAGDPERIYRTIPMGPLVEIFALDMRSYKGANSENRQPVMDPAAAIFGAAQLAWLKAALKNSRATWKIVAADLPLGLIVGDGANRYEAVANREGGAPLGRELEVADLLRSIKQQRIRNVVWITADVHYCAAHEYHPARATFTDFDPFWEFVAGPLNAGTFGPGELDATFGPEAKFVGIPKGMKANRPPTEGFQFFGTLTASARTRALTVKLHNLAGQVLYTKDLAP